MKDASSAMSAAEVGDHSMSNHTISNPLPGNNDTWDKCKLGLFEQWPVELRAYSLTIAAFAYPAAIIWDSEFLLFQNHAWTDKDGGRYQGQSQRGRLSNDTLDTLRSVTDRGIPKEMPFHDFLRDESTNSIFPFTAVLSPLSPQTKGGPHAVMVQLLPKPMMYRRPDTVAGEQRSKPSRVKDPTVQDDTKRANSPLDEHPFFRRFAEMLPSGLAILDHNAKAIFVNQHFWDLTTTVAKDDKSFTGWPQSIHPDDYSRVMDAYREAFTSRRQLRTEFRARGEPHPWRLLLLTPLEDENLQYLSLEHEGGFICSIVDISSEKSAELAEREAAIQARERKEQQERFIDSEQNFEHLKI